MLLPRAHMSSKLREESRYPYHTSLAPPQTQQNTMQRACMMLLIMPLLTAHGKVGARGDGGEGATFDNTTSTEWMTLATARYQVKINQHTGAIISLSAPSPPQLRSNDVIFRAYVGDGNGRRQRPAYHQFRCWICVQLRLVCSCSHPFVAMGPPTFKPAPVRRRCRSSSSITPRGRSQLFCSARI